MTANKNTENSMLEAALKYVEQGWAVLPLHTVVNNMCTCQKRNNAILQENTHEPRMA